MVDTMLDIESLGVGGRCVVLSCAVVPFEMSTGKIFDDAVYYERINVQHSLNEGFTKRQATVDFWDRQPKSVRDREFGGKLTIPEFCQSLSTYFEKTVRKRWKTFTCWSTAAKLDFGCLYNYFEHCGQAFPIPYTAERCARTVRAMTKEVCEIHKSETFDHNPVNDCKAQIGELVQQFQHIQLI